MWPALGWMNIEGALLDTAAPVYMQVFAAESSRIGL